MNGFEKLGLVALFYAGVLAMLGGMCSWCAIQRYLIFGAILFVFSKYLYRGCMWLEDKIKDKLREIYSGGTDA